MGTDFIQNNPVGLMRGRLGIYNQQPETTLNLEGRNHAKALLDQAGGSCQQERMIKGKRRSLHEALNKKSYQGADILKCGDSEATPVRALINPNKLKQDYDDKVVSVDYDCNFNTGDVFEWVGTGTYWLIYLQDLTELAYFRGDIRRCSYKIAWEGEDGERHYTYAAVRGPVETRVNTISKHDISIDTPNLSLNLLIPNTAESLAYFQRYSKFFLQSAQGSVLSDVCWKIQAVDTISTPGIIEVAAIEHYINKDEDDTELGIVGGLVESLDNPNSESVNAAIIGEAFIKPKREYTYKFSNLHHAEEWAYDKSLPLEVKPFTDDEGYSCATVKWKQSYSGQFELRCGDFTKVIVVESLF